MYVSADEVQSTDNVYAKPVKKKKVPEGNDVYTQVDKKKKKEKNDKKNKKGKIEIEGDIYENAPAAALNDNISMKKVKKGMGKAYDENPYENPLAEETKQPKKNVNKDGLIYADLTFNDQPKGQKKLVIHGLDDMTEYVEVDFTKRADPLPDSDEETTTNK
ncbi:uncharacterized protein LOC132737070 [Ruditapes philippinarum]|uniref:uncharacterized protein LOC132737070 n=1 Tax=Ruditapes philippinarum TaxID=129788 RepID=UPI00295B8AA2|nr:uncharacterized protein LOC132737070 [Ruditapes philippinarum]